MKKKTISEGSLTVETALIMPVILMVLVFIVYFLLFLYNRNVMLDAALLAVKESSYHEDWDNEELKLAASARCLEALDGRLVSMDDLNMELSVGKFQVQILITGKLSLPDAVFWENEMPFGTVSVQAKGNRIRPSGIVRNIRKVQTVKSWIMKEEKDDDGSFQEGYESQLPDFAEVLQFLPDYDVGGE